MADIRIKDLTTTASTTAADDFFAADGATNGTRKLSAYSPSFGGNATVGGTLTVSGSGTSAFNGPVTITTAAGNSYLQILAPAGQSPNVQFYKNAVAQMTLGYDLTGAVSLMQLYDNVGGAVRLSVAQSTGNTTVAGTLTVNGTTASTSTSSGALVVSGGVGVAGAINAGSNIISSSSSATANLDVQVQNLNTGTGAFSRVFASNADAYVGGFRLHSNNFTQVNAYRTNRMCIFGSFDISYLSGQHQFWAGTTGDGTDGTTAELVTTLSGVLASGTLNVRYATASTAHTNGALIVGGGLGVGTAINVGTFYGMVDGVSAPSTTSGYAKIYVDSADGDLKVKFGDGTVKTIATDS